MVVYVHAAQTAFDATGSVGLVPYKIVGLGLTGVDIFFVISGVVIAKTAPGLTPGAICVAANPQDRPTLFCMLHTRRSRCRTHRLRLARPRGNVFTMAGH
jgi:hypothetical protein